MQKKEKEYFVIDMSHIIKVVWRYVWIVIIAALIAGIIGFALAKFVVPPKYSSAVKLYVSNTAISDSSNNQSISSSQITAAQSLVNTCKGILETRATLDRVISMSGVDYSYEDMCDMISAGAVDKTEILKVSVTSGDPDEAAKIANCIAEVLPQRITEVIGGASVSVADYAVPDTVKDSPSATIYTAVGMLLGLVISVGVLAVVAILDDTIHDEDYIMENYSYPILARIPNLTEHNSRKSHYYYYKNHNKHNTIYSKYSIQIKDGDVK